MEELNEMQETVKNEELQPVVEQAAAADNDANPIIQADTSEAVAETVSEAQKPAAEAAAEPASEPAAEAEAEPEAEPEADYTAMSREELLGAFNALLKIIEEPPMNTVFLLVSDAPQKIIGTILSRVQQIHVPPIDEASLDAALMAQCPDLEESRRSFLVRNAHGSWNTLLNLMEESDEEMEFFREFQAMMRLAYRPVILDVKAWSEQMGGRKRPWIVTFLQRAQRQIRENFIYNLQMKEITYMNEEEEFFATRFARFIHQNNITGIMDELALAQAQIEQNASMKIVLFDMILKLYSLLAKQAPQ